MEQRWVLLSLPLWLFCTWNILSPLSYLQLPAHLHCGSAMYMTSHINNIDDHIQFTTEPETQGKLPFLDLCVTVLDDTSTKITIYRKPTHTDQYLNFNFHHPLIHKRSVVRTLTTRAQLYVSTAEDRKAEISHVRKTLRANNYKEWALDVPPARSKKQVTTTDKTTTRSTRPMIVLPYIQGLSGQLSRTYQSHGVYLFHKPSNTIRSMLVHHKDKTPRRNCAAPSTTSCVTTTPSTPKLGRRRDPSAFDSRDIVSLINRLG